MTKTPHLHVVPDYGTLDPEPLSLAQIEAMIVDEPAAPSIAAPRLPRPSAPRGAAARALTRTSP